MQAYPTTIEIPMTPQHGTNLANSHGSPCVVCGKTVKNPVFYLHVVDGGNSAALPGYESDPASDLGLQPIGRDCLKNNPNLRPYVHK
jgi:hypothetical protein